MSAHFITISRVVFLVAATGCLGCSNMVRVTTGNRDYNLTVEDTDGPAAKGPGWASEDAIRMIAPAFELLAARQDQSLLLFFQPRHGLPMTPFMVEERGQDYQFIAHLPSAEDIGTIQRVEISAFLIFHLNDILKDASAKSKSEDDGGANVLASWIIKNRTFPFQIESLKHGQRWSGSATATDAGLGVLDQIAISAPDTPPSLLIYRTPAYPAPGKIERTLTYAAVWNDMRIIRVTSPADLKAPPHYVTGHLSLKDMTLLKALVHQRYSHASATVPPLILDAGAFHLILRTNDHYVTDAVSEPVPCTSSIYQVLQFLLASDISDSHIIDFTGAPAQSWVEH